MIMVVKMNVNLKVYIKFPEFYQMNDKNGALVLKAIKYWIICFNLWDCMVYQLSIAFQNMALVTLCYVGAILP